MYCKENEPQGTERLRRKMRELMTAWAREIRKWDKVAGAGGGIRGEQTRDLSFSDGRKEK